MDTIEMNAWAPPELAAMRGAGGVEPIWLPNPWKGGRVLMLGCGAKPMIGAVNHDRVKHSPWVDATGDLDDMPWSYARSGLGVGPFDAVYAYDLVEHIDDVLGFMNEIWTLLKPGGVLVMRGGAFDNPASYSDVTHRHWFTEDSFNPFDRSTNEGNHYGRFYTDSLERPLTEWRIDGVDRVNAHPKYGVGDIQWTLIKVSE